jgi:hypothetical protein
MSSMSAAATTPELPAIVMQEWLMRGWAGTLKPVVVVPLLSEDGEGRDAWFFHVTFPTPDGETWDAEQFAALQREFRDKALEVGLPFPWYIVPHAPADADAVPEDDQDLPDDS